MSNEIGRNNKILSFSAKDSGASKGQSEDFMETLLRDIETKRDYSAYSRAISACVKKHPELKYLSPNWYKIGDNYLKLGTREDERLYKSRLPMLTGEGITISPIYRDSAVSKEGFSAMLMRVPGTKSGDLHHFNDAYHLLTDETKEAAYEDVRKLTEDMGFINPHVLDSRNLGITPDPENQKIIAMDWGQFYPVFAHYPDMDYDNAVKELLKKARNVFFNKQY